MRYPKASFPAVIDSLVGSERSLQKIQAQGKSEGVTLEHPEMMIRGRLYGAIRYDTSLNEAHGRLLLRSYQVARGTTSH